MHLSEKDGSQLRFNMTKLAKDTTDVFAPMLNKKTIAEFEFPSSSSPNESHIVTVFDDGSAVCTCPSSCGYCHHIHGALIGMGRIDAELEEPQSTFDLDEMVQWWEDNRNDLLDQLSFHAIKTLLDKPAITGDDLDNAPVDLPLEITGNLKKLMTWKRCYAAVFRRLKRWGIIQPVGVKKASKAKHSQPHTVWARAMELRELETVFTRLHKSALLHKRHHYDKLLRKHRKGLIP